MIISIFSSLLTKKFGGIKFDRTNEVAIVPAQWVKQGVKSLVCLWPRVEHMVDGAEDVVDMARKEIPPTTEWPRYPCRIVVQSSELFT